MPTARSTLLTKSTGKIAARKAARAVPSSVVAPASKLMSAQTMAAYAVRQQHQSVERARFSGLLEQKRSADDLDVVKLVHNRLPVSVVDRLLDEGVTRQELELVTPARTLAHRRAKAERLTVEESDRAVRLARVVVQAESVFGDKEKAMTWLRRSLKRFDGRTPLAMLATDTGSRLVEEALVQIDEGFFA
jgi:putative toxin-antitoxin system antitoxin component (TIGR02293 family)